MLVSENLNMFKRGRDSRKALDVGMTQVWPDFVKELQDELGSNYEVQGELDEWDDSYYMVISLKGPSPDFIARINTDELTLWAQKSDTSTYHSEKDPNTKMEALEDISNAKTTSNQIKNLRAIL
jgi:hypothetical protein